jgi:hypothetical protein
MGIFLTDSTIGLLAAARSITLEERQKKASSCLHTAGLD